MSFLKKIQKTVGELAQVGFDKVGIRYNPIDLGDDDDPDVQSRDVLDIYRDVMASWNGGAAVPVAQDMQAGLRATAKRYAHDNREIEPAIEAWFGDRRTMNSTKFGAAHAHRSATSHRSGDAVWRSDAQAIENECKRILAFYGVLQTPKSPWISSAFAVCESQKRMVKNLLHQANKQIERVGVDGDLSLADWISTMNERLESFDIAIEIVDEWMTIVDIEMD